MISKILNLFPFYKKYFLDRKELLELLQEYEFRITQLEERSKAHDKRFDYLDSSIQDLENLQSEVF